VLHLRVEDGREREAQFLLILVMLEIDVPGQVRRTGSNRYFHRMLRMSRRDFVEVDKPDGSTRNRAVIDDAAPVIQYFFPLAWRSVDAGRVGFARRIKPADALIHVPAERADNADVVVVPHVAVGHDVETRFLL